VVDAAPMRPRSRFTPKRIALAAVGLSILACAPRVHWRVLDETEIRALPGAEPKITLERNGCTLECPEYRVVVSGDGTVEYEGFNYVKKVGRHTWKIPPARVADLAAKLENAGYFSWDNRCCGYVPDGPCEYTSLTASGKTNRVLCCPPPSGPPDLVTLGDTLESVTGAQAFVGTPDGGVAERPTTGSSHCGAPRDAGPGPSP
jgi:hypothetical protein